MLFIYDKEVNLKGVQLHGYFSFFMFYVKSNEHIFTFKSIEGAFQSDSTALGVISS